MQYALGEEVMFRDWGYHWIRARVARVERCDDRVVLYVRALPHKVFDFDRIVTREEDIRPVSLLDKLAEVAK